MSKTRLLWAAALLALMLSVCAGGALAAISWNVTAENIPNSMIWDQSLAASIDSTNNGTATNGTETWTETFGLVSVDQVVTPASVAAVDRWGVSSVAIAGPVIVTNANYAGTYTWAFDIVAPPVSPVAYVDGKPVAQKVDNKWLLADGGVTFDSLTAAGNAVALTRFPDMGTDALMSWATAGVEECAGRLPKIVGGYPDGLYHPEIPVDRGQMAVFIQRALDLPTAPYAARFPDMTITPPVFGTLEVEALAAAGIVGGYPDGKYWPTIGVNRGQMAAFIARGIEGGDAGIPTYTGTPHFPDVTPTTPDAWYLKYVEYCRAATIVGGYPDGTYQCSVPVDRGQMALFIYRGFIAPSPAVVVMGGVGVTDAAAPTIDDCSTIADNPTTGYVVLDSARLQAATPVVAFQVEQAGVPVGSPIAAGAAGVFSPDMAVYTCTLPALADGDYQLSATVDGMAVSHKASFSVGAVTPIVPVTVDIVPSEQESFSGGGTLVSGSYTDLAATDGVCEVIAGSDPGDPTADWTGGGRWFLPTGIAPAAANTIARVDMEWVAKIDKMANCPSLMLLTSGSGNRGTGLPDLTFTADDTFATATWATASAGKIANMYIDYGTTPVGGNQWLAMICTCVSGGDESGFQMSIDSIKCKLTMK